MKKLLILLLILISFSLTGCKSEELLEEEKQIALFASENSERLCKEYIKQKYGINAKFISYMLEYESNMFYSTYSRTIACKMNYQSKDFYILYDTADTEDIRDNYQEDLVTKDIIKYLQEECNLKEYRTASIKYIEKDTYSDFIQEASVLKNGKELNKEFWEFKNCLNKRYDGNIKEYFSNFSFINLSANLRTESISDFNIENKDLLNSEDIHIYLYNYRNDSNISDLNDVNFNLKEKLQIHKHEDREIDRDYMKLEIEKVNNFEFLYNSSYGSFEDSVEILDSSTIKKEGYEVVSPIFKGIGEGYIDGSVISKIQINELGDVYVLKYYDTDNLDEIGVSNYQNPVNLFKNCNVVFLKKIK